MSPNTWDYIKEDETPRCTATRSQQTFSGERIAPIIDCDAKNDELLASRNPREALARIKYLAIEAKTHLRNKDTTKAFVCLNKIALYTGDL